jgi:hypothetical protein
VYGCISFNDQLEVLKRCTSNVMTEKHKIIAMVQSNYIPWKGYFDLIAAVDEFILLDNLQYTRRDWRNRNQIKTPQGLQWLTVPVKVKGKYHQTIRETEIEGVDWARSHWKSLCHHYRRAKYFNAIAQELEPFYLQNEYIYLSQLNRTLIEWVCSRLGIKTVISNGWDYQMVDDKNERITNLCCQAGGSEYISGPSARCYIEETAFADRNIKLTWFDYECYREYPQLWGDFRHAVSILDLLFNCGDEAPQYMRYVRP